MGLLKLVRTGKLKKSDKAIFRLYGMQRRKSKLKADLQFFVRLIVSCRACSARNPGPITQLGVSNAVVFYLKKCSWKGIYLFNDQQIFLMNQFSRAL